VPQNNAVKYLQSKHLECFTPFKLRLFRCPVATSPQAVRFTIVFQALSPAFSFVSARWRWSCLNFSGASVEITGENGVKTRKKYIAIAAFTLSLSLGLNTGDSATRKLWHCDYPKQQLRHDQNELQRDEEELASDIDVLRISLRHHESQERIARLQYLIRQDWNQIVVDRGQSWLCHEKQEPNLATRRVFQKIQNGPRS